MNLKIRKLGEYWRNFTNGTPNWSKQLALVYTSEGIYRNFDLFLAERAIYEFELEK